MRELQKERDYTAMLTVSAGFFQANRLFYESSEQFYDKSDAHKKLAIPALGYKMKEYADSTRWPLSFNILLCLCHNLPQGISSHLQYFTEIKKKGMRAFSPLQLPSPICLKLLHSDMIKDFLTKSNPTLSCLSLINAFGSLLLYMHRSKYMCILGPVSSPHTYSIFMSNPSEWCGRVVMYDLSGVIQMKSLISPIQSNSVNQSTSLCPEDKIDRKSVV